MEVKYLDHSEYEKWDAFVQESPQGYVWDYSWFSSIVTSNDFRICALLDDDNIIVAGIVLHFFSTGKIVTPQLTQSSGLLFEDMSKRNNMRYQKQLTTQKEYTKLIFDFIEKDIKSFNVCFHYNYDYWLPLYWRGYWQTTRYTYIIDFNNYVLEDEFKRFSKGHKWILNKVEKKSDLKVEEGKLEEYLAQSTKTYERQHIQRPYTDEMVTAICAELQKKDMLRIFKITDSSDRIHAISCFITDHNETYYWLGASDESLRDSGGHTYLIWYAIQYFSDKVRYFNFGGSMIEAVEKNFRNFSSPFRMFFFISKGAAPKHPNLHKIFSKMSRFIEKRL